jgi:hypothetical protein
MGNLLESSKQTTAERVGSAAAHVTALAVRHWRTIATSPLVVLVLMASCHYLEHQHHERSSTLPLAKRSWGGFDTAPETEKCYQQERTAIFLSLFVGVLGVDHWYTRHYIHAGAKLALTVSPFVLVVIFGCPSLLGYSLVSDSGRRKALAYGWPLGLGVLTLPAVVLWSMVDTILWVKGGYYGTPGCPGGYHGHWGG